MKESRINANRGETIKQKTENNIKTTKKYNIKLLYWSVKILLSVYFISNKIKTTKKYNIKLLSWSIKILLSVYFISNKIKTTKKYNIKLLPLFCSFGPSRDYGMDLCLEVYL
jgi:soluble lytic murein transglycosylase-like protein